MADASGNGQLPLAPPAVQRLKVFVICKDCYRQVELVVEGGWDLADVRHECEGLKGFVVERVVAT